VRGFTDSTKAKWLGKNVHHFFFPKKQFLLSWNGTRNAKEQMYDITKLVSLSIESHLP
jgi:hypothetical protein